MLKQGPASWTQGVNDEPLMASDAAASLCRTQPYYCPLIAFIDKAADTCNRLVAHQSYSMIAKRKHFLRDTSAKSLERAEVHMIMGCQIRIFKLFCSKMLQ